MAIIFTGYAVRLVTVKAHAQVPPLFDDLEAQGFQVVRGVYLAGLDNI